MEIKKWIINFTFTAKYILKMFNLHIKYCKKQILQYSLRWKINFEKNFREMEWDCMNQWWFMMISSIFARICGVAVSGMHFLAGFFSKDLILEMASFNFLDFFGFYFIFLPEIRCIYLQCHELPNKIPFSIYIVIIL